MTPKEHARLLGLLFWIYAGLQFVIAGVFALFWFGMFGAIMFEVSKAPRRPGTTEPRPEAIFGIMAVVMIIAVVMMFLFLIPKIVAGFGLRNGRSWAKIWAIVACCIAVLNFPLGTALGVYGFWFIFGDLGKMYFENSGGDMSNIPPPPPNNWQ